MKYHITVPMALTITVEVEADEIRDAAHAHEIAWEEINKHMDRVDLVKDVGDERRSAHELELGEVETPVFMTEGNVNHFGGNETSWELGE